ncbi:hypothetical protein [Agrobacterium burrii]
MMARLLFFIVMLSLSILASAPAFADAAKTHRSRTSAEMAEWMRNVHRDLGRQRKNIFTSMAGSSEPQQQGEAIIELTVKADGSISHRKIRSAEGTPSIKRRLMIAVKRIPNLRPLPKTEKRRSVNIVFPVLYEY